MSKRFGYWVFGKDMNNVKLETLQKNGVTDIFLNYYAFTAHGTEKVVSWIKKAKKYEIQTHIWVQCFYDGAWVNPVNMDLTKKRKEIKKYANTEGVYGIHLDYLRYPGNAYKTANGTATITKFVQNVRKDNPKTFLSCAVMPEKEDDKKYYGQDITALGKTVDCIIPMQYKGNYSAGASWLKDTSQYFSKNGKLWSGLQSYKSDDDTTVLSSNELLTDVKTCFSNGADGVVLFRYGLAPSLNLTSYTKKSTTTTVKSTTQYISSDDVKTMSSKIKAYVEKNKKIPSKIKIGSKEYTYGQMAFILAYAVIKPNTKCPVITVKNAVKPVGDKVNEKLLRDDYLDVAKRLYKYIKTNERCPNYATTKKSKKRLHPKIFVYALAKLVNYQYVKGKNAKAVTVSYKHFQTTTTTTTTATASKTVTTNKVSLHSYLTNEGCSGIGQCTGYYCGPNSLQQCFYRLTGIHVSESTLASVCGTTTDGTDHPSLNTAVEWFNRKYNKKVKITWKNFSDLGKSSSERWSALQSYINKGAVFCHLLYRDRWGHYEVPKSVGDSYLSILNSLGDSCGSGTYCGYIESRSKSEQLSYINGISQKSIAILTLE